MEINELSVWLKETVPGVIILGAAGSALCIATFKAFSFFILKWLPNSLNQYRKKRYDAGYYIGTVLAYFNDSSHTAGLLSLFITYALKTLSALILGCSSLIIFFMLFFAGSKVLTTGSYAVLLFGMCSLSYAVRAANEFRAIHKIMLEEANEGLSNLTQQNADKDKQADA